MVLLLSVAIVAGCGSQVRSDASADRAPAATAQSATQTLRFKSRPDLHPPSVRVLRHARGTAPGYVFVAPKGGPAQKGPMMVDDRGQPVWFAPAHGKLAMDFRVQRYRGKPVLTWFDGKPTGGWSRGEIMIADSSYRTIASVRAVGRWQLDHHDSLITPQDTALVFVYRPVRMSLAPVGGPKHGTVMEAVIQEVDVPSGRLLWEWHSLPHVGLRESYKELPKSGNDPYDYFHINSVQLEGDDLVISARNTHALYKIDRPSGAIAWRLGGKRSNFRMGRGTRFAWQHDAHFQGPSTLTIFDNEAAPKVGSQSRAIALRVDRSKRRVTLARQYRHRPRLLAASQGSTQRLANGNQMVGWGSEPYLTEYSRAGRPLLDMRHLAGSSSYRAYRFEWQGAPARPPDLALRRNGSSTMVYASWNGATAVARWRVLSGSSADRLRPVGEFARDGFETSMPTGSADRFFAVEALDRTGTPLARSKLAQR